MPQIRNALFALLSALALLAVLINIVGGTVLGLWDLPRESDIENRRIQAVPALNPETLSGGSFQSKMERFVSDRLPLHDDVLVVSARPQQAIIQLANSSFGFSAVPAFFDSSRAYCKELATVYRIPVDASTYDLATYASELEAGLHGLMEARQGIKWRIALPDSSDISSASPVHDLVSNPLDYAMLKDVITRSMPDNCQFVDTHIEDTPTYLQLFFHTDHHWQISGAIDCYRKVIQSYGITPIDLPEPYVAFDGQFFGSNARAGRIDYISDVIYDVDFDLGELKVDSDGEEKDLSFIDEQYRQDGSTFQKSSKFESLHGEWFHGNPALVHYENLDLAEDAGTLVIIADSYSNNSARIYAQHFRHVYEVDPRFFNSSMGEFAEQVNATAGFVLLSQESLDTRSIRLALSK